MIHAAPDHLWQRSATVRSLVRDDTPELKHMVCVSVLPRGQEACASSAVGRSDYVLE